MKKSKFTGEQIAFALRQAEVGTSVADEVDPGFETGWAIAMRVFSLGIEGDDDEEAETEDRRSSEGKDRLGSAAGAVKRG